MNVTIGADGYVSVNLAANLGATPAGLYYTTVYHLSDGTTSTEYWVVPAAAQATLSQVRAQVMPAAQAVQAVSKAYVDQSVQELTQSLLTASGGSLSGPLYLNGDPLQPTQAASKHYVDTEFGMAVPMSGAALTGPLTSVQLGAAYQVDQFLGADFGAKLQACINALNATYGGTCDARNFSGSLALNSNLIIGKANATVQLPCATISTSNQIAIPPGTRNVTLHGCALRGASASSGNAGGTVFLYSGTVAMMEVGDPTYGIDTSGFHIDNAVINTTGSTSSAAEGLVAYRTQEMNLASLYFLGNSNQTGMTLDGTGNYTGGTFQDVELGGFGTAVNAIGHQTANAMTTDWTNASTFLRLHIDCPTNGGTPIAGTYGINLQQGDGNTFTGGDVEGCSTALHLGPNAQNNTIVGLRNENSINQVVADAGSSYNNWITGGTMFTGQLTDNGTRNSFLDTFHRSFNGLNGDWYGSQQDATVTNHFRLGTGNGNERGLLNRYQTDFGYRWTTGFSDATAGEQFYQVLDELNNVYRLSIGQYNNGQSSLNNQTVINAAGSGAVVLNGSSNSGTGGIIFGSGGTSAATVGSINNAGNAQFNGTLQVGGPSSFANSTTVKNQTDAEIDSFLWAGATANQKESYTYKDYTGASQWYMVKDASNNWALNSATGGLDSFKAYQSSNSGDTYINASNPTGHIRLNYETGSGAETDIYSGTSSGLVAAFLGSTAIKFPGLAAASGRNCLQIDNSGYISNSGSGCGSSQNGIVNTGNAGQVAYYTGNGNVIAGMNAVAVNAGGTGASNASQALQNLGAQPLLTGVTSDGASGIAVTGNVATGTTTLPGSLPVSVLAYSADNTGATNATAAIQSAVTAARSNGHCVVIPAGTYKLTSPILYQGGDCFEGEGGGTNGALKTILKPAAGSAAFAPANPLTFALGVRFKNFLISGGQNGIELDLAQDTNVDSVECDNLTGWCIVEISGERHKWSNIYCWHGTTNGQGCISADDWNQSIYASTYAGNGTWAASCGFLDRVEIDFLRDIGAGPTHYGNYTLKAYDCGVPVTGGFGHLMINSMVVMSTAYSGVIYNPGVTIASEIHGVTLDSMDTPHTPGGVAIPNMLYFGKSATDVNVSGWTCGSANTANCITFASQTQGVVISGSELGGNGTTTFGLNLGAAHPAGGGSSGISLVQTTGTVYSAAVGNGGQGNAYTGIASPLTSNLTPPFNGMIQSSQQNTPYDFYFGPANGVSTPATATWTISRWNGSADVTDFQLGPSGATIRNPLIGSGGFIGALTGNASTATALVTSPTICPSGQAPQGVDASGNALNCGTTSGGGAVQNSGAPPWLQFLGDGSDGANTTASGSISGIKYYTNFTVPFGNTVTIPLTGLTIHATGTVTIAGKIGGANVGNGPGACGGSGGGSGGGAAGGTAGVTSQILPYNANTAQAFISAGGGAAGAASGGNGGVGSQPTTGMQRACTITMGQTDGLGFGGAAGQAGGSSGGAKGSGGTALVIIANQITGTDGTHTGIIDLSGSQGSPAAANSTGSGSGGGGGPLILSSQNAIPTMPTIWQGGGLGGISTVPYAAAVDGGGTGGYLTLTVSGGTITACAVGAGGSGYVTAPTMTVMGGGGSSATVTATISGGAINGCAVTGAGSGYTAATYTTSGNGGYGGAGWTRTYTGW
jgi:hypothetical protein